VKVAFIQTNPECSLGSMYIASALKEEAECRVFIKAYEDDFYTSVADYKPDVLAFSAFTGEWQELLTISREIKERVSTFSVFGGPHPIVCNPYLSDEELVGLYNTFALYVMAPKELFPVVRLAEADTPFAKQLRKELLALYT